MNLKQRAKQLKTDIPAVYLCLKSADTPLAAKIAAGAAVVYALSPVDLIPDFIPLLGYLDDIIILPALIALAVRLIPDDVLARSRAEAGELWQSGAPKNWLCGAPVVIIWLLIIWLVIKKLFLR